MPADGASAARQFARPLHEVLNALSAHAREIAAAWRKSLQGYPGCGKYAARLAKLHFLPEDCSASSGTLESSREKLMRHGEDLASGGVPAECMALAMASYVQTCLPFLVSARTISGEMAPSEVVNGKWTAALLWWASQCQYSVLSGYARHAACEYTLQEEKIAQTERRAQEFSARLAEGYEKERRRLARDLHDEIGHDLIVLKLYTEVIALDLKKGDIGRLGRKLKESISLIKHALKGVRSLTFDLGPAIWNEQGFIAATRVYTRQFARRTGIKVRFDTSRLHGELPQSCQTALYKVLQGALANVVAHADAQRVAITLSTTPNSVRMKIVDDGKGFNVEKKLGTPALSYGLRAMRDRIELLGGEIHFESSPARRGLALHGSVIELQMPLAGAETT